MSDQFSQEGDQNLKILAGANKFTLWMYEQIKPYLKGHILEIGSGRGNYSKLIIKDFANNKITLSEIDENYIADLQKTFPQANVTTIKLNLEKKTGLCIIAPN
jgi:phospholipid N-methyltransferase